MGYSSLFDIIGSIIIAGVLLIIVINLQGGVSKMTYTYGSDLVVQSNMTTVTKFLEADFHKIGYCSIPDSFIATNTAITSAGPHNISFLADVDDNAIMDTIKYSIGTSADLTVTPNRVDFPLYRQVNNGEKKLYNVGLTQFDFAYFNTLGDSMKSTITDSLKGIFSIRLTVMLQSPVAYDSLYTYAYWRQLRLSAKNLYNR
jgi:hypothetical protein